MHIVNGPCQKRFSARVNMAVTLLLRGKNMIGLFWSCDIMLAMEMARGSKSQ